MEFTVGRATGKQVAGRARFSLPNFRRRNGYGTRIATSSDQSTLRPDEPNCAFAFTGRRPSRHVIERCPNAGGKFGGKTSLADQGSSNPAGANGREPKANRSEARRHRRDRTGCENLCRPIAMSKIFAAALTFLSIFAAMLTSGDAQDPPSPILQLVAALKQQQTQLADNQNNIDQKLADLGETIRVARVFMSRAGGKHKPPPPPK